LWCGIFFVAMTLENVFLFADSVTGPEIKLAPVRAAMPLMGIVLLLYGLVWEVK
jgi:hypothetical protein